MKYYGNIGFVKNEEVITSDNKHTGVFDQVVTEKKYYGEITNPVNRWSTGVDANDNKEFSSKLSIVSDPFAIENFHSIRYAEYLGIKWKVTSTEIVRPRLILTLGGEYING